MSLNITALWDALGWAILHNLWQGAFIGLIVWGVRLVATERRAWLRYIAGMGGMIATFAAFITTFIFLISRELQSWAPIEGVSAADGTALQVTTLSFNVLPVGPTQGSLAETLVPWLGIVWAVGFACLSLQAYRAWSETRRLATTGLSEPDTAWSARFARLIVQSRTHRRVQLFISDHVSGPMTLGALRPIVLVPAGFLTALPPAQVEAILLHELAHIRRHDFLIGLVQTAIRTALYFNPAVIILSRQVDEDREQACDDMAVSVTGDAGDLVRGLAALRLGSQSNASSLGMAADGGPLLVRLNRLMGRPAGRRASNRLSAAAISALMLGTAACSTVSMAHPNPDTPNPDVSTLELPDTVVRADGKNKSDKRKVKVSDLPPMPPMPPMPAVPALPPVPATPALPPVPTVPVPLFGDYQNEDDFESAMDAWGEKMEAWGDTVEARFDTEWEAEMEAWGEAVKDRFEGDWEDQMDAWGDQVEVWAESIEAIAETTDGIDFRGLAQFADVDIYADLVRERAMQAVERNQTQIEDRVERQVELEMAKVEREIERVQRQIEARQHVQAKTKDAQLKRARGEALRNKARVQRMAEARTSHQTSHIMSFDGLDNQSIVSVNGKTFKAQEFRDDLMRALVEDGLVKSGDRYVLVALCEDTLKVDGRKVERSQVARYKKMFERVGFDTDHSLSVTMKRDSLTIDLSHQNAKSVEVHSADKAHTK